MDLRQLIAKMDQIEEGPAWLQEPDWLNEDDQVNEDPLLLVGLGMGLKWLWDKYQQSQAEAEAARKAAEDAKRAGDAAEAARLAAEAAKKAQEAADDKRRAEEANGSKCKAKVGQASAYISQLDDMLKKEAAKKAAGPVPGPFNQPKQPGHDVSGPKTVIGSGPIAQGRDVPRDKPAGGIAQYPSAKESIEFNSSIANALIESFGYDTPQKKSQVNEWSKQDTGDTIRAGYNGLTFGAGDNITAGIKSAFGKDTYAQALEKERAETNKAQARSPSIKFSTPALKIGDKELIGKKDWNPSAYDAANLVGAVAVPIPGVGLAGQAAARGVKAVAGGGKVAKAAAGTTQVGTELAATYGALKGAEHFLDKHTVTTLVTAKGGDVRLGLAQAAMGMDDKEVDGKMGPLTRASLEIVQDENKLPVTGKLDIATAKVLGV
jgi:hypothetical protein